METQRVARDAPLPIATARGLMALSALGIVVDGIRARAGAA